MSCSKRSHATYKADLHDETDIHVTFGTPLPSLDPNVRDDGSYIPVHKQEVRDERGRRRLHGAFTGGWSAGYFNTVGSKEGWTPSTFVSSRTNRRKDNLDKAHHRPEDYMDEEDLADAASAQDIKTAAPFAALGASDHGGRRPGGLAGLIRTQGNTMGLNLLRKMGWKDGQGVGPKVRRKARLGVSTNIQAAAAAEETHLFAPDDVDMIVFSRKTDRGGLGYKVEARLSQLSRSGNDGMVRPISGVDVKEEEDDSASGLPLSPGMPGKKQRQAQRGGFGVGILNDTGSDEDDPYEMGPRISYTRVLGGDKMKKKKKQLASVTVSANPTLRSKPTFISKPNAHLQANCLDGNPPLRGFVRGHISESRLVGSSTSSYPPPTIPPGWASVKGRVESDQPTAETSTVDAARAAQHDPRSRAAVLGESALRGKSIFDYMSTASRERLVAASGKTNLPPARGEIPAEYARSGEQMLHDRLESIPILAKETAIAAMSRGAGAGGPYVNDEAKRARYRLYLQTAAGFGGPSPIKPPGMTDDDFVKEIEEFHGCAQLFKPMTGFMATRFTTASIGNKESAGSESCLDSDVQKVLRPYRPANPAEEAAKMGMYGRMTRLTEDFFPTRLLCKRFNVRPPAHVQPDPEPGASSETRNLRNALPTGVDAARQPSTSGMETNAVVGSLLGPEVADDSPKPVDDASKAGDNTVVEASRPSDEVFKAIFGDSSDEDE